MLRCVYRHIRASAVSAATNHWSIDIAMGVGVAILNVTNTVTPAPESAYYSYHEPHLLLLITVMAGSGLALIWRRHAPVEVALVVLAIFALVTYAEWQPGSIGVSVMIALYSVGAHSTRRNGIICVLVLVAICVAMTGFGKPFFDGWVSLVVAPVFAAPWFVGRVALRYRLAGERDRARVIALERQQAVEADRAVTEERLRIAREFHDVVSHTLTVISVQSGVARHLLDEGNAAAGALEIIEESSRAALDDLRRMLGVLRNGAESASLSPSPGLDELELLASAHRASHGPVEMSIDAAVASAPVSLRLTIFRLVQESLTNVARHARGASAWVSVREDNDSVIVTVVDDGAGPSDGPDAVRRGGYGLAGMRERVDLFGGSLETGPRPGGGFQVRAVLPREIAR